MKTKKSRIVVHPVTPERWSDFETLFGPNGACGGCWCMYWRFRRKEFEKRKGAGNKRAIKKIIMSGATPGLIAYVDGSPVGWCAIAPRADYPVLANSRILAPVDDRPVWSISCLFVARGFRRLGVSVELIKAAVKFARSKRAKIVEGYPHELKKDDAPAAFIWTGTATAFRKAGFIEVERRSETRPIMRYIVSR